MQDRKLFWLGILLIVSSYILSLISSNLDNGRPKGDFSTPSIILMVLSFFASFLGSYLVLKAKGRSWRFIALAILSLIGHLLIIFVVPDKHKKKVVKNA